MQLAPGTRLRSQVCETEVIVVKGGSLPADLTCGGHPMKSAGEAAGPVSDPEDGLDTGTLLGKRYGNGVVEVLVTRAGRGTIAVGREALPLQDARQLPSSD